MKLQLNRILSVASSVAGALAISLCTLSGASHAGPVDLATVPLTTATTTKVLPNLMYIQDNSGSMNWDFIPDKLIDGNYCKGVSNGTTYRCCRTSDGTAIATNSKDDVCNPHGSYTDLRGMPPFQAASFNRLAYNPDISYERPVDSLGNPNTLSYGTDYGAVPYDGYGKQTSATVNLKTSYPDVEWCTDNTYTNCVRNDNYILPGTIGVTSYTVQHATTASGSASFATGTAIAPTVSTGRNVGPFYYVVVPGEYCTAADLRTCQAATAASVSHPYPAPLRWCDSAALTNCKATGDTTFSYPRYPTIITSGMSTGRIQIRDVPRANNNDATCATVDANKKVLVSDITLNGVSILATKPFTYCNRDGDTDTRNRGLTLAIIARIGNGFIGSRESDWNRTVEITTPIGPAYNGATLGSTITTISLSLSQAFAGGASSAVAVPGEFKRIDIVSGSTYGNLVVGGTTIIDRSGRTDCAARPNCTDAEELRNYANWLAWYRSRLQMMKTSVSQAFKTVDTRYRVGFITINDRASNYLAISKFNTTQKANWYAKLFNVEANGGTPLRSTLARVGRIYSGQARINSGDEDPVEYSCQQNFALLTTDGYWNSDSTSATDNPDVRGLIPFGSTSNSQIGNQDALPVTRPQFEGPTATFNTLADVAKYFNTKDLRNDVDDLVTGQIALAGYGSTTNNNCLVSGADDDNSTITYSNRDVCANNVFMTPTDNNPRQHMTTFTLGLGVDGTLQYQADYKTTTDPNSDFYRIREGTAPTLNWPVPTENSETTVDDLWHAAVNGGGTYFSAKDPAQLNRGLNSALASITAQTGAGAAAATSTLTPTNGDNFAYVASYTTAKWTGNLEARCINTQTGIVSEKASWCAENVAGDSTTCNSPSTLVTETSNGCNVTYCVSTTSTPANCTNSDGIFVAPSTCKVEIRPACTGTLLPEVVPADVRSVKVKGPSGTLIEFDSAFATANPGYFNSSKLAGLSQWPALSSAQQTLAVGPTLVNYLRGNKTYEDSSSNTVPLNRLFRTREAVLGDLIDAQPVYMGKPQLSYVDSGYSAFAVAQTTQYATTGGTVYAASNDGMLHAFDARNGNERWAYVPTPVLPELWRLADNAYGSNHRNYVNGTPVVTDVYCPSNCGTPSTARWRTILIGGLNSGGRGYYAIDVTNPDSPSLIWEYTNTDDKDLGYTFGNPIITKKTDGTWVVVFASGYNNATAGNDTNGDGKGYVYVLDANSGARLSKIPTNEGSNADPSGLAKLAGWADNLTKNNTVGSIYGGDLKGNLWRFNINAGTAFKLAILRDSSMLTQPVTSEPSLGLVNGKRVVFVGTGRYLGTSDLTTTQRQTVYAIKDDSNASTIDTPRTATGANAFVAQTLTTDPLNPANRIGSNNSVDWTAQGGWYVDLFTALTGEGSERVHINMDLTQGVLAFASTVPASSVCNPGGYGYFTYLNYATGGYVPGSANGVTSSRVDSVIVGINVFYINGGPKYRIVKSDKPTPLPPPLEPPGGGGTGGFQGKRAIWRELVQ